jgi:hypothetical protein
MERQPVEPRPSLPDTAISTFWGPARLLAPPLDVDGIRIGWDVPPAPFGRAEPAW